MRKSFGLLVAVGLLASTPALAGNLEFKDGDAIWTSVKCTRPTPPESVLDADPETKGSRMNAIMKKRNAYAEEVESYMNCISHEAEGDQSTIVQAISSGAQKEIDAIRAEAQKGAVPTNTQMQ